MSIPFDECFEVWWRAEWDREPPGSASPAHLADVTVVCFGENPGAEGEITIADEGEVLDLVRGGAGFGLESDATGEWTIFRTPKVALEVSLEVLRRARATGRERFAGLQRGAVDVVVHGHEISVSGPAREGAEQLVRHSRPGELLLPGLVASEKDVAQSITRLGRLSRTETLLLSGAGIPAPVFALVPARNTSP